MYFEKDSTDNREYYHQIINADYIRLEALSWA